MIILKTLDTFVATLRVDAENSDITAKKPEKKVSIYGIGAYGSPDWNYEISITYGSAENFLHVKTFGSKNVDVVGRGCFENVQFVSFMITLTESHCARFIVIPLKQNKDPALPDGGIAFDINPEEENQHGTRFELRFTAVNHTIHRYGTGFAVSEPGEPDDGVAVFFEDRKLIITIDEIIRKAQRLRANRKIVTALRDYLLKSPKEETYE